MRHLKTIALLVFSVIAARAQGQDSFLVKPYLNIGRTPTASSMQILWHALDGNAVWAVEYKTGTSKSWNKASAPKLTRIAVGANAPRYLFNTTLGGLTPGETFQYRVRKANKIVFTTEGKAAKSPEQPYRFVAFGDIGAGTPAQKQLAYRAYTLKPDLVVVPGDIVYSRGLVSEYDVKFWPIYNADSTNENGVPLMRTVPFVVAPGNHDTGTHDLDKYPDALAYFMFWDQPLNGPLGAEGGPMVPRMTASESNRKAFLEASTDSYPQMANYSFNYGNTHWTVVDSNPYVDWTDQGLKDWVINDLLSAQNATWRFVMFHHPGFNSSREHYEDQQMRLLSPIFEKGKVDIVFAGHVHNYQRSFPMTFEPDRNGTLLVGGKDNKNIQGRVVNGRWTLDKTFGSGDTDRVPKGIIYLVTGAGGQKLYNPEQNDDPDSWQKFTDKFVSAVNSLTVVDVNGKSVMVRQLTAEGKEVDHFKIKKD